MPNWPAAKMLDTVIGSDVPTATQLRRLEQVGLTRVGVMQLTRGDIITSATDRALVARLAVFAVSDG